MKDELTDKEHLEILKDEDADNFGRIITFQEYTEIGYEADDALRMAELQLEDIDKEPFLRAFYLIAKKKEKDG